MRFHHQAALGALLFAGCKTTETSPSPTTLADWLDKQERNHSLTSRSDIEGEASANATADPFQLPAPATPARTIDLREVIALVESQGLDVELARERYVEAQAEQEIAEAAWFPSLTFGTTLYRNEGQVQNTPGAFLDVTKQNAWAGGGFRMDLDLGEAIYGTRAARHRTAASLARTKVATRDAATLAALAYFELVESHARLPIAEDALAQAEELVGFSEARLKGGAGLEADVARARAFQATIQRAAIEARLRVTRAASLLTELLQLPAQTRLTPDPEGSQELGLLDPGLLPWAGQDNPLALEVALRGRPEFSEADAALEASEARRDQAARGWLYPNLVLGAQIGALGFNYADLGSQDVYTASLQWDLGVELFGNSDRMESKRRQASIAKRRTMAMVRREVTVASAEFEAARLSVEATRLESEAAQSSQELAIERHERGAALLIERLDAEVQSLRARAAHAAAKVQYNRALFSYARATGLLGTWIEHRE